MSGASNVQYNNKREWEMTYNPRISFLKSITKPFPTLCPECEHEIVHDNEQIYCPECGLVCYDTIEYVGLRRIDYPFRQ